MAKVLNFEVNPKICWNNDGISDVLEKICKSSSLELAGIWLWNPLTKKTRIFGLAASYKLNNYIRKTYDLIYLESPEIVKDRLESMIKHLDVSNVLCYPLGANCDFIGWLILGSKSITPLINEGKISFLNQLIKLVLEKQWRFKQDTVFQQILKQLRLLADNLEDINNSQDLIHRCLEIIINSNLFLDAKILLKEKVGDSYAGIGINIEKILDVNENSEDSYYLKNIETSREIYFHTINTAEHIFGNETLIWIPIFGLKRYFGVLKLSASLQESLKLDDFLYSGLWAISGLLGDLLELSDFNEYKENSQKRLTSLQFAVQHVSTNLDLSQVLSDIVKLAAETLNAKLAWISLVKKETPFLRPDAFVGLDADYLNKIQVTIDDSVTSKGPSGKAIKTKKPNVVRDTQLDPDFGPWREQTGQHGYRSIVAVPILFNNKALGMIAVYSSEVDAFKSEDVDILQAFANFTAVAINNACLIDELQNSLVKEREMLRVTENYNLLLENSLNIFRELTRLLLEGQQIEDIIRVLAKLIGNPVRVEDRGKVVYWESDSLNDFPAIEVILKQPALARERTNLRKRLQPVYVQANPNFGCPHDNLVAPIVLGQEVWGYISITLKNNIIDKLGFLVIDKEANVLGMALLKEKTSLEIQHKVGLGFLQDLIEGQKEDIDIIREAGYLNYDLSKPTFTLVIDIVSLGGPQAGGQGLLWLKSLEALRMYLKNLFKYSFLVANDKICLICINNDLISIDSTFLPKTIKQIKQILKTYLPHHKNDLFTVVIGGLGIGVKDIRRNFIEALQYIELAKLLNKEGQILVFGDLDIYAMIYKAYQKGGADWLNKYVNKYLGRVLVKDRQGIMIETLKEFIKQGKHITNTAKKLYTHPNTISYRVKKIEDLLNISLNDMEEVQKIVLALKGHDLLKSLTSNQSGI